MSGQKARDARILKKVLQILGEKDESIRQAFGQFDGKVQQAFGMMEFKIGILVKAMCELGMTEQRLQEISEQMQQEMQSAQQDPQQAGGENNEHQPYGEEPSGQSGAPVEEQEVSPSEEGGAEHFG